MREEEMGERRSTRVKFGLAKEKKLERDKRESREKERKMKRNKRYG